MKEVCFSYFVIYAKKILHKNDFKVLSYATEKTIYKSKPGVFLNLQTSYADKNLHSTALTVDYTKNNWRVGTGVLLMENTRPNFMLSVGYKLF